MDLARQAAELIAGGWDVDVTEVAEIIERHGVLVSHEDAETLKRIKCLDPLTLDRAVEVMGREPDESASSSYRDRYDWGDTISFRAQRDTHKSWLKFGGNEFFNPTVGQFACLVLAAKMGGQS